MKLSQRGLILRFKKTMRPFPAHSAVPQSCGKYSLILINNALDAMPDGGTISIKTMREGARIILTIADTGVGIPEAIRDRILIPFSPRKGFVQPAWA